MNCVYCSKKLVLTAEYENYCRYSCDCFPASADANEHYVDFSANYSPELESAHIDFYYEPHKVAYYIWQDCRSHQFAVYHMNPNYSLLSNTSHFKLIYGGICPPAELKERVSKILNNLALI